MNFRTIRSLASAAVLAAGAALLPYQAAWAAASTAIVVEPYNPTTNAVEATDSINIYVKDVDTGAAANTLLAVQFYDATGAILGAGGAVGNAATLGLGSAPTSAGWYANTDALPGLTIAIAQRTAGNQVWKINLPNKVNGSSWASVQIAEQDSSGTVTYVNAGSFVAATGSTATSGQAYSSPTVVATFAPIKRDLNFSGPVITAAYSDFNTKLFLQFNVDYPATSAFDLILGAGGADTVVTGDNLAVTITNGFAASSGNTFLFTSNSAGAPVALVASGITGAVQSFAVAATPSLANIVSIVTTGSIPSTAKGIIANGAVAAANAASDSAANLVSPNVVVPLQGIPNLALVAAAAGTAQVTVSATSGNAFTGITGGQNFTVKARWNQPLVVSAPPTAADADLTVAGVAQDGVSVNAGAQAGATASGNILTLTSTVVAGNVFFICVAGEPCANTATNIGLLFLSTAAGAPASSVNDANAKAVSFGHAAAGSGGLSGALGGTIAAAETAPINAGVGVAPAVTFKTHETTVVANVQAGNFLDGVQANFIVPVTTAGTGGFQLNVVGDATPTTAATGLITVTSVTQSTTSATTLIVVFDPSQQYDWNNNGTVVTEANATVPFTTASVNRYAIQLPAPGAASAVTYAFLYNSSTGALAPATFGNTAVTVDGAPPLVVSATQLIDPASATQGLDVKFSEPIAAVAFSEGDVCVGGVPVALLVLNAGGTVAAGVLEPADTKGQTVMFSGIPASVFTGVPTSGTPPVTGGIDVCSTNATIADVSGNKAVASSAVALTAGGKLTVALLPVSAVGVENAQGFITSIVVQFNKAAAQVHNGTVSNTGDSSLATLFTIQVLTGTVGATKAVNLTPNPTGTVISGSTLTLAIPGAGILQTDLAHQFGCGGASSGYAAQCPPTSTTAFSISIFTSTSYNTVSNFLTDAANATAAGTGYQLPAFGPGANVAGVPGGSLTFTANVPGPGENYNVRIPDNTAMLFSETVSGTLNNNGAAAAPGSLVRGDLVANVLQPDPTVASSATYQIQNGVKQTSQTAICGGQLVGTIYTALVSGAVSVGTITASFPGFVLVADAIGSDESPGGSSITLCDNVGNFVNTNGTGTTIAVTVTVKASNLTTGSPLVTVSYAGPNVTGSLAMRYFLTAIDTEFAVPVNGAYRMVLGSTFNPTLPATAVVTTSTNLQLPLPQAWLVMSGKAPGGKWVQFTHSDPNLKTFFPFVPTLDTGTTGTTGVAPKLVSLGTADIGNSSIDVIPVNPAAGINANVASYNWQLLAINGNVNAVTTNTKAFPGKTFSVNRVGIGIDQNNGDPISLFLANVGAPNESAFTLLGNTIQSAIEVEANFVGTGNMALDGGMGLALNIGAPIDITTGGTPGAPALSFPLSPAGIVSTGNSTLNGGNLGAGWSAIACDVASSTGNANLSAAAGAGAGNIQAVISIDNGQNGNQAQTWFTGDASAISLNAKTAYFVFSQTGVTAFSYCK